MNTIQDFFSARGADFLRTLSWATPHKADFVVLPAGVLGQAGLDTRQQAWNERGDVEWAWLLSDGPLVIAEFDGQAHRAAISERTKRVQSTYHGAYLGKLVPPQGFPLTTWAQHPPKELQPTTGGACPPKAFRLLGNCPPTAASYALRLWTMRHVL